MHVVKRIGLFIISVIMGTGAQAQTHKKITYFDLSDVRLLESPFKNAEQLDLKYLLEIDANRLLAPFLREAKLASPLQSYENWENTGLDGHIGGHYISALSYMYAATGNMHVKDRLDHMLATLKKCQDANGDGYIGGVPEGQALWQEVREGKINASGFSLNERWVPLYNIHKTYAGLRDAYLLTGDETAKEMLIAMTDWAISLVEKLSEQQIQNMLNSEHGGLNETFADVAAITQEPKYLILAKKFSQKEVLTPLLKQKDSLTGKHANTQIPKVLGFKRIADLEQDRQWEDAARYFWENVIEHRSVSIGGNSVNEHFNPVDDFSRMIHEVEGPETCNTYNMLRLTRMLYQTDPQSKYLDYYERGLYNHILSTQHPETGGLVYFTQMRPGHYRVYSQPHTSMWCCVGSGIENHAKYGEMIYAHNEDQLYVHLFIPSNLQWRNQGVEIIQNNNFPNQNSTHFTVNTQSPKTFTFNIRKPSWLTAAPIIKLNDEIYQDVERDNAWISIKREWKTGDRISIDLPMHIYAERLPDQSNYYSILYGPIVLAAKFGTQDLAGLFADDSRMGHVARGARVSLEDVPILTTTPEHIPSLVKTTEDESLHFTLTGLQLGTEKLSLKLEPFYKIHDARYIIYWPQATIEELEALQQKTAKEEKEMLHLETLTVDRVVSGEQQPESDHFIKENNSHASNINDLRWREAKGWFSYMMKTKPDTEVLLYVRYLNEANRKTDFSINDKKLGEVPQSNDISEKIGTIKLPIPSSMNKNKSLKVNIAGSEGLISHKILEIRIIEKE